MSWSSYCDNLVASGCVDKAAVCGLDDGGVWSQTAGFNVSVCAVMKRVVSIRILTLADIRFVILSTVLYLRNVNFCLN